MQRNPHARRIRSTPAALSLALTAVAVLVVAPAGAAAADPALEAWRRVLSERVEDGGVDYAALKRDRAGLDLYLRSLAGARPSEMEKPEAIAFWTNAYNAVVLHHVLERYPGIESVRDVDGFFDELTFPVAGEELTLDAIEGRGRDLGDPRVHFAVVCASTSCPDLRGEPYEAGKIDAQLRDQTRRFLSDESKGLRWEPEKNTLWLSSIFKWYAGDFTGGSTLLAFFARGGVLDWVVEHAPPAIARKLRGKDPSVRYMDYDWGLNDR
ncbi:MAG TPA: DUF547 domain-containing protein [Thermoanaerobaculia bacterium]|nr:DUF547 domain-containing protein [Thermoanaerobaculia bacterium]